MSGPDTGAGVPQRVLMVCTGNICRSPTAEAVLRRKLALAGLSDVVEVDSAGTSTYHVGESPDPRSQGHAILRGYDLSAQRARAVRADDFQRFGWILAMDRGHLASLRRQCPAELQSRLRLLMSFAPAGRWDPEVGDPYYGGAAGFEQVLDQIEAACDGLVRELSERAGNFSGQ